MSTRGCFGWRVNGQDKIGYNHWDSYPSGLGSAVLEFIRSLGTMETLKAYAEGVELIDDEDADPYHNGEFDSEFCDAASFLKDSLFCEWAYIINVDTGMLEIYKGFNKNPDAPGRYAKYRTQRNCDEANEYCGVALVRKYPLQEILDGKPEKFTDEDKFTDEEE